MKVSGIDDKETIIATLREVASRIEAGEYQFSVMDVEHDVKVEQHPVHIGVQAITVLRELTVKYQYQVPGESK